MNKKELLAKIESALNNSQTSVIAFQDYDNPQIKEMLIKAQANAFGNKERKRNDRKIILEWET